MCNKSGHQIAAVDHICDSTIGNILKAHGIEPAPTRLRTGSWETFLNSHWDIMASIDFTTVEVWTKGGLTTFYLLFVMELKTRRVHFAGCTTSPHEGWMNQAARELTNCEDGFPDGKRYLILDRDTKFSQSFRSLLSSEGALRPSLPKTPKRGHRQMQSQRAMLRVDVGNVDWRKPRRLLMSETTMNGLMIHCDETRPNVI